MKIAFVSLWSAKDIQRWSGLTYHIARALEMQDGVEIVYIDDLAQKNKGLSYLVQGIRKVMLQKIGKHLDIKLSPWWLRKIGRSIDESLPDDIDVVFSDSTIPLAYLKTDIPKVFYTDATFTGLLGFYRPVSAVARDTIHKGKLIDKLALEKCSLAIYSSRWAADSAVATGSIESAKVKVVPFGANIDCSRTPEDIRAIIKKRAASSVCNLLFLGVDWKRKGGDFAVEVVKKLNESGVNGKLHLAGVPEIIGGDAERYVVNHGFISKKDEEGRNKLYKLMEESHFLILPTKADCTPVVYSEANSFGLPVISTNVGGISSIITEGINGKTFSLDAAAEEYVEYIKSLLTDKQKYEALAESSFSEYADRLNWKTSGRSIVEYLKNIK